ncbi:hypothetical protein [Limnospira platensis]|uniref:hypothetical protein n=1 Tax=Limnospira platensis TaxID=118562 RepID=UPI003D6E1D49
MTMHQSTNTLTQNDDEFDRVLDNLDKLINQAHNLEKTVEDDCNEFEKLRKEIQALYHQYQLTL